MFFFSQVEWPFAKSDIEIFIFAMLAVEFAVCALRGGLTSMLLGVPFCLQIKLLAAGHTTTGGGRGRQHEMRSMSAAR